MACCFVALATTTMSSGSDVIVDKGGERGRGGSSSLVSLPRCRETKSWEDGGQLRS